MSNHGLPTVIASLAVAAIGMLGAGCGSDPAPAKVAQPRPDKPELAAPGRPGAVVAQLGRYITSGAIPAAVLLYEPRVRQAVGLANLAGALSVEQAATVGARFSLVTQTTSPAGPLISVQIRLTDGTLYDHVFVMHKSAAGWRVGYDTAMAHALASYVTTLSGGVSTPKARRAAIIAGSAFRTALFDDTGRLGDRAAGRRRGVSQGAPATGGPGRARAGGLTEPPG